MNKFHQIPTDTFIPISHDNSYLFNHYDKVANFLAFNLEKNYKNILAKPVQNGYVFDWFSVHENLVNINGKSKEESENELAKYWQFIEVINAKISQLSCSSDENNKNWANLLAKVFNSNDNFIFSNGKDICIVWGWKFNNNENYKPNISKTPNTFLYPDRNAAIENVPIINKENEIEQVDDYTEPIVDDIPLEDENSEEIPTEEVQGVIPVEESSFLKFLKWFASNFWWLLWLLLLLIIFFLLLKSCDCSDNYNDINTKLNQLEQKANDCGN
ncbi:hypothetical protein [Flavobacterium sp.]|uniref:hypothetical protein n=1 Tax=Flavobacterium sp. TaxID=239 RepID=UPI002488F8F6|nr:hypothetical protein [Flavobacterium sp.]MDI1317435.1 hypothetical protein [Flavobacterium sp.]